jgi:hypothetical protein
MSVTMTNPTNGDVRVVPDALEQRYADRGFEVTARSEKPAASGELKGKALDEALDAAGLPKTGSADDKRARLAEHTQSQPDGTPPQD